MAALRPLLLMTRPDAASRAFCAALPEATRAAVEILINPLMSIRVTGPIPLLDGIAGLIFTSANALHAYEELGGRRRDIPVISVGDVTAARAEAMGFRAQSAGGNADRLVQYILDAQIKGPLMHLRGDVSVGNIAQRLSKSGVPTSDAILYEQNLQSLRDDTKEALSQDRVTVAPVFSPRTATQLGGESVGIRGIRFAAMSEAVAAALPANAASNTRIAQNPDRNSMIELVVDMVAHAVALERSTGQM